MAKALSLVAYNDLEGQVEALERDGYVYFPSVLDTDEIAELRATMERLQAIPESHGSGSKHLKMATNSSTSSSATRLIETRCISNSLTNHPIIEVVEAAHGEDCHCIGMHSWLTGPGRPDQGLHTDWLPISLPADVRSDPRVKVPIFITTAHYYLNDMYEELGPTKFVPGQPFLWVFSKRRNPVEKPDGREYPMQCGGMWCSSVVKSGIVALLIRVTKPVTSCRSHYAMRMITQKYPPYLNKFQFDESILVQANPSTETASRRSSTE